MELFFTDDHASDLPASSAVDGATSERVLSAVAATHPGLVAAGARVERMGGPGIGSQSFRVGDHFVKILPRGPDDDHVRSIAQVTAALATAGIPVERPIPDRDGRPFGEVHDGHAYLYVQRYVSGGFFDGTREQLEALLPALYGIGPALRGINPTGAQLSVYRDWDPRAVLLKVSAILEQRISEGTADAFDALVREHLPLHERIVGSLDPAALRSTTLHHFDLHPHNVLFRSGRPAAILDLAGIRAVRDEIAIGFAFYKLGRKGVSLGRMSPAEVRALASRRSDPGALARAARIEVARRATVVLRLHYLEGTREWDRDVRKHLVGPREIDALFSA
ncbi:MAG: hypothetical protein FJ028_00815 [Chloroflexi bacterium]|nr:hypothetical protein [Chloroflexota bacterium]